MKPLKEETNFITSCKLIAVKTIILSIFGLCCTPFLASVFKYMDAVAGVNSNRGVHTNYIDYIWEAPVNYIVGILIVNIIVSIAFLVLYCKKKNIENK